MALHLRQRDPCTDSTWTLVTNPASSMVARRLSEWLESPALGTTSSDAWMTVLGISGISDVKVTLHLFFYSIQRNWVKLLEFCTRCNLKIKLFFTENMIYIKC